MTPLHRRGSTTPLVAVVSELPRSSPSGLPTNGVATSLSLIGSDLMLGIGLEGVDKRFGIQMRGVPLSAAVLAEAKKFCRDVLWEWYLESPERLDSDWRSHAERCYPAYAALNETLAEALSNPETVPTGSQVWAHDYPLQLLPGLLKAVRPDLEIGYSHRITWPSVDLFERIPYAEELLRGLAGADLVGFHTRLDRDNFRGSLRAFDVGPVNDGVHPTSVDYEQLAVVGDSTDIRSRTDQIRSELGNRVVIGSIGRISPEKGMHYFIEAVGSLLNSRQVRTPDHLCALIGRFSPHRHNHQYSTDLRQRLAEINGEFSEGDLQPVQLFGEIAHHEMPAYLGAIDVLVATPTREGLNRAALEWVAARPPDRPGVLVLSRGAGVVDQLAASRRLGGPGAIVIEDPSDTRQVTDAVVTALAMDPSEQLQRLRRMRDWVQDHDAQRWADDFLDRLGVCAAARRRLPDFEPIQRPGRAGSHQPWPFSRPGKPRSGRRPL